MNMNKLIGGLIIMSYESRSPQTEREIEEDCWLGSDSSLDPINGKDGLLNPPPSHSIGRRGKMSLDVQHVLLSDSYLTPIPPPSFLRRPDISVGDQMFAFLVRSLGPVGAVSGSTPLGQGG